MLTLKMDAYVTGGKNDNVKVVRNNGEAKN